MDSHGKPSRSSTLHVAPVYADFPQRGTPLSLLKLID